MSNELRNILHDSLERLFLGSEAGLESEWSADIWDAFVEMGIPLLMVNEENGGASGSWEDAYGLFELAGRYSIPLPIAECMLATKIFSSAGGEIGSDVLTVATNIVGKWVHEGQVTRFTGVLKNVPWGRYADRVIVVSNHRVYALQKDDASITRGQNLAGEPRDTLTFDNVEVISTKGTAVSEQMYLEYCALARLPQIAGCMAAALECSIQYATERKQFGRAIGRFQTVQQQLAVFGCEVAIVTSAARAACRAADFGDAFFQISAAKLRANQAVGLATSSAHQVHGAMGFTQEYPLRKYTQRLWSWRTEFGNDRFWSEQLGKSIAVPGADNFWRELTARDDLIQNSSTNLD
jgi:acyl-CoA dehydrogenase